MKKILKLLMVGVATVALFCCTLPAAFAADTVKTVYSIGLDPQGGSCTTLLVYTSLTGKLESTPEQPVMDGYTFDGWYTEPVGGSKVSTSTVFTSDATIYAHWVAKNSSSTPAHPSTPSTPFQWQQFAGPVLVAGALLTTLVVASML